MATTLSTELTLAQYIAQFRADVNLAHIFVQGGPQEEVVTEGGTYPTIAKIVEDNKIALQESLVQQGFAIRNYNFQDTQILHVKHNMNSTKFVETITDVTGRRLHANTYPIDPTEFVVEFTEPESGSVTVVFCINT